jgi:hypothetical protein
MGLAKSDKISAASKSKFIKTIAYLSKGNFTNTYTARPMSAEFFSSPNTDYQQVSHKNVSNNPKYDPKSMMSRGYGDSIETLPYGRKSRPGSHVPVGSNNQRYGENSGTDPSHQINYATSGLHQDSQNDNFDF